MEVHQSFQGLDSPDSIDWPQVQGEVLVVGVPVLDSVYQTKNTHHHSTNNL